MISNVFPITGLSATPPSEPALRRPIRPSSLAGPLAPDGWLLHNYFHTFLVMVVKHSPKGNLPLTIIALFTPMLISHLTFDDSTIARIALSVQHHRVTGCSLFTIFHRQRSRGGHRHPTLACPASSFRRGCLVLPNVKHRRLVPHIYQFPSRLLMVIPSARDRPCPESGESAGHMRHSMFCFSASTVQR